MTLKKICNRPLIPRVTWFLEHSHKFDSGRFCVCNYPLKFLLIRIWLSSFLLTNWYFTPGVRIGFPLDPLFFLLTWKLFRGKNLESGSGAPGKFLKFSEWKTWISYQFLEISCENYTEELWRGFERSGTNKLKKLGVRWQSQRFFFPGAYPGLRPGAP